MSWFDNDIYTDISDSNAIIAVKEVDYCCITHVCSKSEAIRLLDNSILDDHGYI